MRFDLYDHVQSLLSIPPLRNLQLYMAHATLPVMTLSSTAKAPQMPPEGHVSHMNLLSITPQHYRKLEQIHRIDQNLLRAGVAGVVRGHIPCTPIDGLDEDDAENVTIPCQPTFELPTVTPKKPATLLQLCRWVLDFPLDSVQAIMHNLFVETDDWSFHLGEKDVDSEIFTTYVWSPPATNSCGLGGPGSACVFVQPPWILSPKDLELFVRCHTLRPADEFAGLEESGKISAYTSKERLWGKIWDECYVARSHHFVLTTYWGWVFGGFSRGRERAFVTDVMDASDKDPTLLEMLFCWLGSALGIEGSWEIPEVSETLGALAEGLPLPRSRKWIAVEPSESEWDAGSIARKTDVDVADAEEEEAVYQYLAGENPPRPLPEHNHAAPPLRRQRISEAIACWRKAPQSRFSSPALSAFSDVSTSTVRDFGDYDHRGGDWLAVTQVDPPQSV